MFSELIYLSMLTPNATSINIIHQNLRLYSTLIQIQQNLFVKQNMFAVDRNALN